MKTRLLAYPGIALLLAAIPMAQAADPLPRSTPEAQGISSQAIVDFVHQADTTVNTFDSFMILRHGKVIAEGYWKPAAADIPHILNSVSKSFNATAIGLAIHEHKLKLTDHVLQFFPADAPPAPSANLRAMTVRDLLTMSGGADVEPKPINGDPSVRQFLAQPLPYPPGTHFQYNTMGAYTLSAIVTRVTGQTTLEFLKPRLFAPLGIENPRWDASTEGNSLGGYGLYLRTEDIAKFGQLYLQKGKWNGRQLIPRAWVEEATSKHIDNSQESHAKIGPDWVEGYGYQFWRCRHNAYRADGAGGQFIVVMPDQDAVVAITANTGNLEGELNAIWDNLLPPSRPTRSHPTPPPSKRCRMQSPTSSPTPGNPSRETAPLPPPNSLDVRSTPRAPCVDESASSRIPSLDAHLAPGSVPLHASSIAVRTEQASASLDTRNVSRSYRRIQ